MSNKPIMREKRNVDFIGMLAGFLCASHCLLSATAPIWISVLGLGSLFSRTAEVIFVLFGIMTAIFTIFFGLQPQSATKVRGLLILGIVSLLFSQYLEMTSDHHAHHESESHQTAVANNSGDHDSHKSVGHDEHKTAKHDEHKTAKHDEHKTAKHDEHEGEGHSNLPILISIFGGLMIVSGHFSNIRSLSLATHD
ncbi:MAG: hypothetical protein CMH49_06970 [Myxococcales bacterium]|nr:hypothetical protein [Myxococcales bacterium]